MLLAGAATLLMFTSGAAAPSAAAGDAVAARRMVSASPFSAASVKSANGQDFDLSWTAPSAHSVKVYARRAGSGGGARRLVAAGGGSGAAKVSGLPPAPRWYFEFVADRGRPLVTADRSLHLSTAPNFRDVGGFRTADGRWVKKGLMYRSDQLDRLSDADLETVRSLDVRLVCDLRSDHERERGLDRLPAGASALIANVMPDTPAPPSTMRPTDRAILEKMLGDGRGVKMFDQLYVNLVSSPTAQAGYRTMFLRIADEKSLPGVFHCSAGKDRTGWAAAVLLTILGVPRDVVIDDYMESNVYLAAKNRGLTSSMDPETLKLIEPVLLNRPEYIERSFAEADRRYGSFDNYVRGGLGLEPRTVDALRRIFLAN